MKCVFQMKLKEQREKEMEKEREMEELRPKIILKRLRPKDIKQIETKLKQKESPPKSFELEKNLRSGRKF